jgi:Ca2+-binding RTX toxin-like protein
VAAGGTVNVEAGQYPPATVGAKPLTISIQGGPALTLGPDSLNAAQAALTVVGSPGNDVVTVNPGPGPGQVKAVVNNQYVAIYALPLGRIVMSGQGGDDYLQVVGGVSVPAWLYGGDGNDTLLGGAGNDLLLGGAGDDSLTGGQGRDILIGGTGADTLTGGPADDLLIAGSTAYDADEAALYAVMAEWTSARDYATRTANLSGTGTGSRLNGNYFLRVTDDVATTTVFDDVSADVLTGGGGQDWFFANLRGGGVLDLITDLGPGERADDLTFVRL